MLQLAFGCQHAPSVESSCLHPVDDAADKSPWAERPMVAVWQGVGGLLRVDGPYLRVAIWDGGHIVFAKDPRTMELEPPAGKAPRGKTNRKAIQNKGARENAWTHELYEGAISGEDLARLKKAIADTGVFDLKRTSALVPDAPVDYILVDIAGRQQLLLWDERETPNYGIDINPTPDDKKFIATWKGINRLALSARPTESTPVTARFQPPDSWRDEPKK